MSHAQPQGNSAHTSEGLEAKSSIVENMSALHPIFVIADSVDSAYESQTKLFDQILPSFDQIVRSRKLKC